MLHILNLLRFLQTMLSELVEELEKFLVLSEEIKCQIAGLYYYY
jgi:hypothetical protein